MSSNSQTATRTKLLHRNITVLEKTVSPTTQESCPLCDEVFGAMCADTGSDVIVATINECGHTCCLTCLEKWCANSNTCPWCREEIFEVPEPLSVAAELALAVQAGEPGAEDALRFLGITLMQQAMDRLQLCFPVTKDFSSEGPVAETDEQHFSSDGAFNEDEYDGHNAQDSAGED